MTTVGVILGTAAYMAPEQAKGKPVDRRSDLWAFGCVLYEMLTGRRAFEGEDVTETIAAVVRAVPDWSRLPATTPQPIRRLLRRCLEKNSRERLTDAGSARLEIKEAISSTESDLVQGGTTALARRSGARFGWIAAAAMAVVAMTLGAVLFLQRDPATATLYRSSILPSATPAGDPSGRLAISPDGRRLAFVAPGPNGRNVVWVRPLAGLTAQH